MLHQWSPFPVNLKNTLAPLILWIMSFSTRRVIFTCRERVLGWTPWFCATWRRKWSQSSRLVQIFANVLNFFRYFFLLCSEWFLFESSVLLLTLYKIRGVYSWASELTKLCGIRNFGERLQATKISTMYFSEVL